ncbi:hypothetical protein RB195_009709 [Necator americanus]|uniref:Uncharacterized protein n=1 Tax=Necator americanus TaxID=51031 RepID=A0ABR1CUJ7_NECAM
MERECVKGIQGVVVRWCRDYVIVWSVEYNHSFIILDKSVIYDRNKLYPTHWLCFDVDPEIVDSPEGFCTRAFNPRAVEIKHSLNPETTEHDYNDFNSFVYQFAEFADRNTIRFKTRLKRIEKCPRPALFDQFIGEVDVSLLFLAIVELKQLARPGEQRVWEVVNYVHCGKEVALPVLLCKLGKKLYGAAGRLMDRNEVIVPPNNLQPAYPTPSDEVPSMFAENLTRDERMRRNVNLYGVRNNEGASSQTHYESGHVKPWGQLNSTEPQSAVEQTINMDCITVFRRMEDAAVKFYVIFSKTHKFGILCDGGIDLEIGKWARLQYVGGDFKCGQFLDSRNMRLINYIAPPRFVDAKKFKLREMQNDFEYIVILALRARIQFSAAGDPIIESDTVGRIKIDEDWARRSEIPALLPNRAVIEIEFVRDSWYLRKLHCNWHDNMDIEQLDSPYIRPGYTVEEMEEICGLRCAHGVEGCREFSFQQRDFHDEQPEHRLANQRSTTPYDDQCDEMNRRERQHSEPEVYNVLQKWIAPAVPPSIETVVDLTDEKPSGRDRRPIWCCVVHIRDDNIICYTPVAGIHKIVVPSNLLEDYVDILNLHQSVRLGAWFNVMCEPRCSRQYDDFRIPHFSHIAVEVCTPPQPRPPVENWEQREIHGLFQFRVYCDLRVIANVQRVLVGNEKWLKLLCRNTLQVLAPQERLEGFLTPQLTADKTITFWATRKKRVLDCDLFLMDFESIEEE